MGYTLYINAINENYFDGFFMLQPSQQQEAVLVQGGGQKLRTGCYTAYGKVTRTIKNVPITACLKVWQIQTPFQRLEVNNCIPRVKREER